jgi:hypothetical protein
LGQNGLCGKDIWQGVSKSNSMCLTGFVGGSGVNTCSGCLAKTSAFSLSLLAQFVSGFLIGGIGVCRLLNFLLPSRLSGRL